MPVSILATVGLIARNARPVPDPSAIPDCDFLGDSLGYDLAETGFVGSQFRVRGAITFANAGTTAPEQWWYAARLLGATGRDLAVRVDWADLRGTPHIQQHWGVWTLDPESDLQYPILAKSGPTDDRVTLTIPRPLPRRTIYLGRWWFYPFSRVAKDVQRWSASPFVSSPLSATHDDFITGLMTVRTNYNGRTIPALPMYAMRITDPATLGPKNQIVLMSGNHPGETAGRFVFAAAVDFLLSDHPQAALLRETCEVHAYPCINPQGVHGGYFRSSPQHPTVDHNRDWTDPVNESIQLAKAAIQADTGGSIHALLDYHSLLSLRADLPDEDTMSSPWIEVGWRSNDAWASAVAGHHPSVVTSANPITGSSRHWIASIAGENLRVSATVEESTIDTKTIADHRAYGVATMRAIADLVAAGVMPVEEGVGGA